MFKNHRLDCFVTFCTYFGNKLLMKCNSALAVWTWKDLNLLYPFTFHPSTSLFTVNYVYNIVHPTSQMLILAFWGSSIVLSNSNVVSRAANSTLYSSLINQIFKKTVKSFPQHKLLYLNSLFCSIIFDLSFESLNFRNYFYWSFLLEKWFKIQIHPQLLWNISLFQWMIAHDEW